MKNNRVLIIHNILWSHYTSTIFRLLFENHIKLSNNWDLMVAHIANNMENRKNIGDEGHLHTYPYKVLFEKDIESIGLWEKVKSLVAEIIGYKPTHLVVFGFNDPAYWFVYFLAKIMSVKLVVVANSTYHDHPRKWWRERLKSIIIKPADAFMCYGKKHKSYLEFLGVPSEKIMFRVQATDNLKVKRLYQKSKNSKCLNIQYGDYLLFVGRLIPQKNLERLLWAYKVTNVNYNLVIIGDGVLRENLQRIVARNEKIFFLGPKRLNEVVSFYGSAKALILPSISETWGLVVNEAMLCELPVLVSNHCGCSNDLVAEGRNGYTFRPNNIEEIIKVLEKLDTLSDSELESMGKYSAKIIDKYTPELASSQFFKCLEKI